jgi:hypothetical protein
MQCSRVFQTFQGSKRDFALTHGFKRDDYLTSPASSLQSIEENSICTFGMPNSEFVRSSPRSLFVQPVKRINETEKAGEATKVR